MTQDSQVFIQEFEIFGLFGYKDICLVFKNSTLIIIGENGCGKTTVLKAMYYVLKGLYDKLLEIQYSSIRLRVDNKDYFLKRELLEIYVASLGVQLYSYSTYRDNQSYPFECIIEMESVLKKKGLKVLYWPGFGDEKVQSNDIMYFENRIKLISDILQEKSHENQKGIESYERAILKFRDICNKYLTDKRFVYDKSSNSLTLYRHINGKTLIDVDHIVELDWLSHGEKRIISIYTRLYLEPDNSFAILMDEPELALSIFWQECLLSEILDSDKCKFLLVMTHSPFIFNNTLLKKYTSGIKEFLRQ